MTQDVIFAPMGAVAALTFIVLMLVPIQRFRAAAQGKVRIDDFTFGESASVPGWVALPNRNYMNLLELPTLFYSACLMFYLAHRIDELVLVVAWSYVVLRCLHSAVHLTYNNVKHRLGVFALSNVVLGTFWVLFFVR